MASFRGQPYVGQPIRRPHEIFGPDHRIPWTWSGTATNPSGPTWGKRSGIASQQAHTPSPPVQRHLPPTRPNRNALSWAKIVAKRAPVRSYPGRRIERRRNRRPLTTGCTPFRPRCGPDGAPTAGAWGGRRGRPGRGGRRGPTEGWPGRSGTAALARSGSVWGLTDGLWLRKRWVCVDTSVDLFPEEWGCVDTTVDFFTKEWVCVDTSADLFPEEWVCVDTTMVPFS